MAQEPIDLGQLVSQGHKYELNIGKEPPEDAAARRAAGAADAALKRKMTYVLFCFALIVTAIVFGGCVYVFASGSADDKKWAAGIVSAIASGLVGFLVGQGKR